MHAVHCTLYIQIFQRKKADFKTGDDTAFLLQLNYFKIIIKVLKIFELLDNKP